MSKTPMRGIRVPDKIWEPALDRARREGTTLTAVLTRALTRYTKEKER